MTTDVVIVSVESLYRSKISILLCLIRVHTQAVILPSPLSIGTSHRTQNNQVCGQNILKNTFVVCDLKTDRACLHVTLNFF